VLQTHVVDLEEERCAEARSPRRQDHDPQHPGQSVLSAASIRSLRASTSCCTRAALPRATPAGPSVAGSTPSESPESASACDALQRHFSLSCAGQAVSMTYRRVVAQLRLQRLAGRLGIALASRYSAPSSEPPGTRSTTPPNRCRRRSLRSAPRPGRRTPSRACSMEPLNRSLRRRICRRGSTVRRHKSRPPTEKTISEPMSAGPAIQRGRQDEIQHGQCPRVSFRRCADAGKSQSADRPDAALRLMAMPTSFAAHVATTPGQRALPLRRSTRDAH